MYYDIDDTRKRDNIEVMEEKKKKNNYLLAYALYASVMRF